MVSAGTYILGVAALAAVAISLGLTAVQLRRRLLPGWEGAPARLVESVAGVALLIWISEILGTLQLFYAWALVLASALLAVSVLRWPSIYRQTEHATGRPRVLAWGEGGTAASPRAVLDPPPPTPPAEGTSRERAVMWLVTVGVIGLVFAHWGLTAKDALDRGIFNFDSLWYHMPFAAEMVQSHSVTGLHYTETVFTNWLYPQNSELLHAVGILLTERDTLSLFVNFGFLAIAFLAAWCIGRPYGRGQVTVVAAAVVLECHTLVVREPGAAKNDLVAAALLLAAVAVLVNAWVGRRAQGSEDEGGTGGGDRVRGTLPVGWSTAAAGLAVGLAVGTKSTAVAMAAALTVAVIALVPTGRRWAAAGWWFVPAFLGGGYWYLRNLVVAGNPLPQATGLGPISLPHPERLQHGRPDFSIVHYLTDPGVWREYFGPGLDQAFGALWPLVIAAALVGALVALLWGGDRALRWIGAVALFGLVAYLFTPLSAAGAEGAPAGFGINIRYAIPALLLGLTLLPLVLPAGGPEGRDGGPSMTRRRWWGWAMLAALLLVLVVTNRADAVARDPARVFAIGLALLLVGVPAALLLARARGAAKGVIAGGFAALALLVFAIGYPIQRDYLQDRFAAGSQIPGLELDSAYRWARDVEDSRIGLAGTTAGFLQYGFYGTDLSNQVVYLGQKGPHGAFNAIPTCPELRAAVNEADLDYLITSPFLNFLHTDDPVPSPEARWLRDNPAATPIQRSGPVTIWKLKGKLDPTACNSANAPLRRIPDTPKGQSQ